MDNSQIAATFDELYERLALVEKSPYRILAYRKAASTFRELPVSAQGYFEAGTLEELEGVGPAIAEKVSLLFTEGTFPALERAREQVPDGLVELTRVPGIGTKGATKIWEHLAADTFADVVLAAEKGTLKEAPGVGAKAIDAVIAHAAALAEAPEPGSAATAILRDTAEALIMSVTGLLHDAVPELSKIHVGGQYARGHELVDGVDLALEVATGSDVNVIERELVGALERVGWTHDAVVTDKLLASTATDTATATATRTLKRIEWHAATGTPVRLLVTEPADLPDAMRITIGPVDYAGSDDLAPELRDRDDVVSGARPAPADLLQLTDLKAELHCHSDWSDGHATIREMALAALERGDTHMAMTDHSAPYAMVNGLTPERLAAQADEIAEVNAELAGQFVVIRGTELEINSDGSLGLNDVTLAKLDWVVASIHINQRQTAEVINERMRKVMANPLVDAIGHPTSRLLLQRPSTALDIDMLIELAAATGTVLELNASPRRLDLDSVRIEQAIAAGVRIQISSDAHRTSTLGMRHHGVSVARRALARRSDVVNCLTRDELENVRRRNRA